MENADVGTLLKRSCDMVEKKRGNDISSTNSPDGQTSDSFTLRSQGSSFNYLTQCIACEKTFNCRKKASCAMTKSRKAEELNDRNTV
jgi:hypothetical protein